MHSTHLRTATLISLGVHLGLFFILSPESSLIHFQKNYLVSLSSGSKERAPSKPRSHPHPPKPKLKTNSVQKQEIKPPENDQEDSHQNAHPLNTASNSEGDLSSNSPSFEEPSYIEQIRNRIESALVYPPHLRQRRIQGRVKIRVILNLSGEVKSREVTQTSGFEELDELALRAVDHASPFGPVTSTQKTGPQKIKSIDKLVVNLPIDFKLK